MGLKKYRAKKFGADIEPHEVFLDTLTKNAEEEIGVSPRRFEVLLGNKMSYALFGIFCLVGLGLFAKVFYYQAVQGKAALVEAENNKGSLTLLIPERGIIYDSSLTPLVFNGPAYDVACDKNYFSSRADTFHDAELRAMALALGIPDQEVADKIAGSDSAQVLVAQNISHEQLLALESAAIPLNGCSVTKNTMRNYGYGPVFSHLLGYTGRINQQEYAASEGYSINDYIGKVGLEKQYEPYLRGIPGKANPRKSTAEKKNPNDALVEPVAGDNLVLHVDAAMQELLYESLASKLKEIGAERGAAVVMDPRNGAVLALVSYPAYDNNWFSGGISQDRYSQIQNNKNQPLFNRSISAQYPTGSVIKPLEAAAALQEGIISPEKQINDIGYILVPSQYDPSVVYRFGGVTPHGWVDMREAIAVSSNIYFYSVGAGYQDQKGLGPTRIKHYLSLFGWNEKTGIDLPGEFGGFIPDPEWKKSVRGQNWVDGDTYNLSIGQSDLQTTPLQVAVAYAAIANGGTLYQPQVAQRVIRGSGSTAQTLVEFAPQVIRENFIDLENLQVVREGMRDAVSEDYGLSRSLRNLPVSVASKTGTAQIPVQGKYNLWSASFAPYENPEIVVVVTAEEVAGLGAVTLPVTHDVMEYFFKGR